VAEGPQFDMTITREAFLRLLPGALGGAFRTDGETCVREEAGRSWAVHVEPLPPLVLGAMSMARLRVTLAFEGLTEEETERFRAGFLAAYQRGGG